MTNFESIRRGGDNVMRPLDRVFSGGIFPYYRSLKNPISPQNDTLEIRNITTHTVNDRRLLNRLHLEVQAKENICIVSTKKEEEISLLEILSCLKNPTKGSMRMGSLEITQNSRIMMRRQSYLFLEDPWVFNGSILENITFGSLRVHPKLLQKAIEIAGINTFIDNFSSGLQTKLADIPPLNICRRRQIHIARAWLSNPKIIFMIEPTSGLDNKQEKIITEALCRLRKNRTTITFSHQLKVARGADRVLVLDKGRLLPYSGQDTIWLKQPSTTVSLWDESKKNTRSKGLLLKGNTKKTCTEVASSSSTQILKIERKQEILPQFVTTGLLSRNDLIDTWIAWSSKHICPVRIKVPRFFPVEKDAQRALLQEYEPLRNFTHPSIAVPYEAELGVEFPYTMYEYLGTSSLSSILRKNRTGIRLVDVLLIAYDLAGALNEIHKGSYTHLNIAASRIRQRDDIWVMTDFSHLTKQGAPITKKSEEVSYQPPELQKNSEATYAMDVYGLGRLMHLAATGNPLPGENDFTQHMIDQSLPQAPQAMRNILRSMLAKDPKARPSMERVEWELKRLMPLRLRNERALKAQSSLQAL